MPETYPSPNPHFVLLEKMKHCYFKLDTYKYNLILPNLNYLQHIRNFKPSPLPEYVKADEKTIRRKRVPLQNRGVYIAQHLSIYVIVIPSYIFKTSPFHHPSQLP